MFAFQELRSAHEALMAETTTLARQFEQEQHMSETLRMNLRDLLADHEKVNYIHACLHDDEHPHALYFSDLFLQNADELAKLRQIEQELATEKDRSWLTSCMLKVS